MIIEDLIVNNLKLINFVIKNMNLTNSINYDDYYQVGAIGLIYASKSYNSNLQISFSTYAYICIKNQILKYIKSFQKEKYNISIDEQIYENLSIEETIADKNVNIIETIIIKENNEELHQILNSILTEEEKMIIKMLYGIGCKQCKQIEVSQKLNIPQYKISRIKNRVLKKIEKFLNKNYY